ncbi:MAG: diaminobutyrate--2-oxoglutarate transaminase [Myxococcales bacterium]|nr:diaminobutyrate--2-oxoglutarate transaminase [Myxococcales bacterium]
MNMQVFARRESEVRGYCRSFPAVFARSKGAELWDEQGRRYIDFFAGAGALNYGHNPEPLKGALLEYLTGDNITHALDLHTQAKRELLEELERTVLTPRGLDYKVQFPGPTGTNAVEAALKLARKVTGRTGIASFTNAFHGMTLGSLAVTGNQGKRQGAGVPVDPSNLLPFCGYFGPEVDSLAQFEALLEDTSSGFDVPAAVVVETVQAEGGINVASADWLQKLRALTTRHDILLIVDDIQVGCGRTGTFFSFEEAGIVPDIVCLSKSLSGYGLPLSLVLLKPELDVWAPGEHNGTFRGHNPAFVTATAALRVYWKDDSLTREVQRKGAIIREELETIAKRHPDELGEVRGRGMILGVECTPEVAARATREAFRRGLMIETAGTNDQVLKVLCPLVIDDALLREGLTILAAAIDAAVQAGGERDSASAAE